MNRKLDGSEGKALEWTGDESRAQASGSALGRASS